MKQILIAVTIAVLGASGHAALADPTLDTSPNSVWRNAPESTGAQTDGEGFKFKAPYEELNGNFVN